jgi:2-keto-4-pentenoate hydratase/2-oxohepta-3-ene-1,7-dioic acid hydratase in catechol pathway
MKAVLFTTRDGSRRIGVLDGERVWDAGPAGEQGFVPTAEAWRDLAAAVGDTEYALDDVQLAAPLRPGKVLAIGLNYRTHIEETGLATPDVPLVFAKLPSSVVGPYDDVIIPREETRPDFEGEVGVVIGKRVYRASTEHALKAVGGYLALNDVTGRRAQLETPQRQFTLGKSFDTFMPLGPAIVSPDEVAHDGLSVRTVLSGELMQEGSTADLLFSVPVLIEYLSRGITLEPGDLIATGTPGGVGDERKPPRYLREGDVLETIVDGVGTLRNAVRREA